MADQNITELPIKTNSGVASTDYMLGIDSAEGYQILVRDVAKYIVENYNGSTIAGSAQTVQSAVNALNSNLQTVIPTQTTERGKTFAEHIQLLLDADKLPIGKPFFLAVSYYEKGQKPTLGYLYLASTKVYGTIFVPYDTYLVIVAVTQGVASQKTVALS